jgi:UTP--glucose-1-phosphate uridylyltransferase
VTTAVIPCGGRGTRMASVAGVLPKELLPVAGKPLLQWTLEEAAAAGIEHAVVVTSPDKPQIAEFLSHRPALSCSISLVVQSEPRGLGDAITCARPAVVGDEVAVLLPDNLFGRTAPAIGAVLDAHRRTGLACVLIAEIPAAGAAGRGAVGQAQCRPRSDGLWDVVAVRAKVPAQPSTLTPIGRLVFDPGVFDHFERLRARLEPGAELDDVPLLQELASEGRLVGVPLAGPFFDVGLPDGYRDALAALT